jgi:hypothetical protein
MRKAGILNILYFAIETPQWFPFAPMRSERVIYFEFHHYRHRSVSRVQHSRREEGLLPCFLSSIDLRMCPKVFCLCSSLVARFCLSGSCAVYMSAVCVLGSSLVTRSGHYGSCGVYMSAVYVLGSEGRFGRCTVVLEQLLVCASVHLAYCVLFLGER